MKDFIRSLSYMKSVSDFDEAKIGKGLDKKLSKIGLDRNTRVSLALVAFQTGEKAVKKLNKTETGSAALTVAAIGAIVCTKVGMTIRETFSELRKQKSTPSHPTTKTQEKKPKLNKKNLEQSILFITQENVTNKDIDKFVRMFDTDKNKTTHPQLLEFKRNNPVVWRQCKKTLRRRLADREREIRQKELPHGQMRKEWDAIKRLEDLFRWD